MNGKTALKQLEYWIEQYYRINGTPTLHEIKSQINLLKDYEREQLRLYNLSKSLPTKKYEIDFGGNILVELEITNNEPTVIGAMNGWGNGISNDDIIITEK